MATARENGVDDPMESGQENVMVPSVSHGVESNPMSASGLRTRFYDIGEPSVVSTELDAQTVMSPKTVK